MPPSDYFVFSQAASQQTLSQQAAGFLDDTRSQFRCRWCELFCFPFLKPVYIDLPECAHIYYESCANELVKGAEGPAASCLECAARFVAKDVKLLEDDGPSFRVLLNVNVDCPLFCGWDGAVGDLEGQFAGCPKARCELCLAVVKFPETVAEDEKEACPRALVDCKHEGYEERVPRAASQAHETFCGHGLEACSSPGCEAMLKKMDLEKHMEESKDSHLIQLKEVPVKTQVEFSKKAIEVFESSSEHLRLKWKLEDEIRELKESVTSKKNKVERLQEVETRLKSVVSTDERSIAQLKAEVEEKERKLLLLTEPNQGKDAQNSKLRQDVNNANQRLESQKQAAEKAKENANRTSTQQTEKNRALEQSVRAKDTEIAKLRAEITKKEAAKKDEIDALKTESETLVARKDEEISALKAANGALLPSIELGQRSIELGQRSIVLGQRYSRYGIVAVELPCAYVMPDQQPNWKLLLGVSTVFVGRFVSVSRFRRAKKESRSDCTLRTIACTV